ETRRPTPLTKMLGVLKILPLKREGREKESSGPNHDGVLLMVATIADARVADLIRAGKVRVGLFPPQYTKEPVTGELRSVWVEIARALAARIGVQVVLLEHSTPPQVVDCLKADACDVVFLPFDSRAAEVGGFSSPFIEFDFTYLVPLAH